MSEGKHIGNMRLSKKGKGVNIHLFAGTVYGTISLGKLEELVDEARINGKSDLTVPIMSFELDNLTEIVKVTKSEKHAPKKAGKV